VIGNLGFFEFEAIARVMLDLGKEKQQPGRSKKVLTRTEVDGGG
jgi:hypothetical protein